MRIVPDSPPIGQQIEVPRAHPFTPGPPRGHALAPPLAMSEIASHSAVQLQTRAVGKTDVGRQREHNEDNLLVAPHLGLFVVADGMGGNNAGEVASALGITSMDNFFRATESGPLPTPAPECDLNLAAGAQRLAAAVRKANTDIF